MCGTRRDDVPTWAFRARLAPEFGQIESGDKSPHSRFKQTTCRQFRHNGTHPPDLAIEIDIASSSLDRLEIYSKLRIPEIWRFDGESLHVLVLQPNGLYLANPTSSCLPQLPVAEIVPFLQPDDQLDDTTRVRQFIEWASPRFKKSTR